MIINFNIVNDMENNTCVDNLVVSKNAPNIIFCCTPICPVTEFEKCYVPFADAGYNVFALDFLGAKKNGNAIEGISLETMQSDFECCIKYIKSNFNENIFLFGDTGIGGIIAQYFASYSTEIRAFAQFGVGIYKDLSPMKMTTEVVEFIFPISLMIGKLFPKIRLNSQLPKYNGIDFEKEVEFYAMMKCKYPEMFKLNISFINALITIFVGKHSYLKTYPKMPTLVFKTCYDRYFSQIYFNKYYSLLKCKKRIVEVDGVHNSYYFKADFFAEKVIEWFNEVS